MMSGKGLVKLLEECGELSQVAAKKLAYLDTDAHPDGKGSLKKRLEDEIGDVMAACNFVALKLRLNNMAICERTANKIETYIAWDAE